MGMRRPIFGRRPDEGEAHKREGLSLDADSEQKSLDGFDGTRDFDHWLGRPALSAECGL
jgi:hypothetical protein